MSILDDLKPGVIEFLWNLYGKKNYEGTIPVFYRCQFKRISIGVGFLAEDLGEVKKMPFVKIDQKTKKATMERASASDIENEWNRAKDIVQDDKDYVIRNGKKYFKPKRLVDPKIMLDPTKIREPFNQKNEMHLKIIKKKFSWYPAFLKWPADAQLGIMAIAYGGPGLLSVGKTFGKVVQACNTGRFDKAAEECLRANYGKSRDRKEFFAKCFKAAHNVRTDKGKKSDGILHICSYFGPIIGTEICKEVAEESEEGGE